MSPRSTHVVTKDSHPIFSYRCIVIHYIWELMSLNYWISSTNAIRQSNCINKSRFILSIPKDPPGGSREGRGGSMSVWQPGLKWPVGLVLSSPREELILGELSEGRGCCLAGFLRGRGQEWEECQCSMENTSTTPPAAAPQQEYVSQFSPFIH